MKSGSDAFSGKLMGPEFPRTPMDLSLTMSGWPPSTRIMTVRMWPPSCPSVGTPHVMASTPARRDRPWCSIQVQTHLIYIRNFVEKTFRMHEGVLYEMTLMIYFSGQWWVMFPARLGEERQTVAEPGHQAQTRDYSGSGDKRLSQTLINKTLWCVSKVNKSKKGVSFNYSYQCWHFRTQTWPRCQCCEGRAK